jgi:hypothetical protein
LRSGPYLTMAKGTKTLSEQEGKKAQADAISRDYILDPHLGACGDCVNGADNFHTLIHGELTHRFVTAMAHAAVQSIGRLEASAVHWSSSSMSRSGVWTHFSFDHLCGTRC